MYKVWKVTAHLPILGPDIFYNLSCILRVITNQYVVKNGTSLYLKYEIHSIKAYVNSTGIIVFLGTFGYRDNAD